MRGISTIVIAIILLVLILLVVIPAFIIFNSVPVYSSQAKISTEGASELASEQNNQIFRGNPNVYYNSSTNPSLQFTFASVPTPFNITQIYYFNGTEWVPTLNQTVLVVAYNTTLPLPKQVFNKPIIIVTGYGNIYFLNPNTSITTVTISGPAGKVPVYITAFIVSGSKLIPVSLSVTFQGYLSFLTPKELSVDPGTYSVVIKNSSMIFLPNYGLTAVFQNWSIAGYGTISNPNSLFTTFTVTGAAVLTAIYKANLQNFTVKILPSNIPLGTTISQGGASLTSLNSTIPVIIDNRTYYVGSSGITLNLTNGYHVIQFPTQYNITFNYTYNSFHLKGGEIVCYQFSGLSSNTSKIQIINNNTVFINSSGTIYGNYKPVQTYYLVKVYNDFHLPPNATLISNTTPVLGNIAGQLLLVKVEGTSTNITLGPVKNYEPQRIYFKAGTSLNITVDYMNTIYNQTVVLSVNGAEQTFHGLLGNVSSTVVVYTPSNSTQYYYVDAYFGYYGTLNVTSPLIIVNEQEWAYGGNPPS
ncbi:MAG: hypothetical protein RXN77_02065 [Sulfolobaceae archaeon]|nr:hypothetical protein [Sulfolobales archaeon]